MWFDIFLISEVKVLRNVKMDERKLLYHYDTGLEL